MNFFRREWKWIGISPTRESLVNLFCVPVFHYFTSFQITVSSTYKSWEGIVDERPTINHAKCFTFSLWMRFILSVKKVKLETLGSSSDPSNFYMFPHSSKTCSLHGRFMINQFLEGGKPWCCVPRCCYFKPKFLLSRDEQVLQPWVDTSSFYLKILRCL